MSLKKASDVNYMSFEEFLKIEDEDLKKYLFSTKSIGLFKIETRFYENDKKIAFYNSSKQIKKNNSGKFYVKDTLNEWIVYEKSSGKIKMSSSNAHIKDFFMNYYFKSEKMISMFFPQWRITKSFIKRVIEDKINTTEDILKYIKSYIIKNKDISLDQVYRLCTNGIKNYSIINVFKDPENLVFNENFFKNYDAVSELHSKGYFKIEVSNLPKVRKMVDDYEKRQGEKTIDVS
jgi:hypothetical protein